LNWKFGIEKDEVTHFMKICFFLPSSSVAQNPLRAQNPTRNSCNKLAEPAPALRSGKTCVDQLLGGPILRHGFSCECSNKGIPFGPGHGGLPSAPPGPGAWRRPSAPLPIFLDWSDSAFQLTLALLGWRAGSVLYNYSSNIFSPILRRKVLSKVKWTMVFWVSD
jgi:hypothetical protein